MSAGHVNGLTNEIRVELQAGNYARLNEITFTNRNGEEMSLVEAVEERSSMNVFKRLFRDIPELRIIARDVGGRKELADILGVSAKDLQKAYWTPGEIAALIIGTIVSLLIALLALYNRKTTFDKTEINTFRADEIDETITITDKNGIRSITIVDEASLPSWLTIDTGKNTLTVSGTPDAVGDYSFTVIVKDKVGYTHEETITIHVTEADDEPTLFDTTTFNLTRNRTFNDVITIEDLNTFSDIQIIGLIPSGLTVTPVFSDTTGTVTIDGTPSVSGIFTFDVQVTDKYGNTVVETITLDIVDPIDYSTQIDPITFISVTGYSFSHTVNIEDDNGINDITILSVPPAWLTVTPNFSSTTGSITLDGTAPSAGVYTIDIQVIDSDGYVRTETITINVSDDAVTTFTNTTISYPIVMDFSEDIVIQDGDEIQDIIIGPGAPSFVTVTPSFNGTNGIVTVSGKAFIGGDGTYNFDVTVIDTNGISQTENITLIIQPDNFPSHDIPYVYANILYMPAYISSTRTIDVTDLDGINNITFIDAPAWMNTNVVYAGTDATITVDGIPPEIGSQKVYFIVEDSNGVQRTTYFTLVISHNTNPIFGYEREVYVSGTFNHSVRIVDSDNIQDVIIPDAGSLPAGFSMTAYQPALHYYMYFVDITGTGVTPGQYDFTITVIDDEGMLVDKVITIVVVDGYNSTQYGAEGGLSVTTLNSDATIDGVLYSASTEIWFHANIQTVERGYLAQDTTLNGITYKANTQIKYYKVYEQPNLVKYGTLANPTLINGVVYPADTYIHMDTYGNLIEIILPDGVTLDINSIIYRETVEFYPNGNVSKGGIISQTINGIYYSGDFGTLIELYDDGTIKTGMLGGFPSTNINGIEYAWYSTLNYYPSGQIKSARLYQSTDINGITYQICWITFYESGAVKSGIVDPAVTSINGIPLQNTQVKLYESGNVQETYYLTEEIINGIPTIGTVIFYDDGSLMSIRCYNPNPFTVNGVQYYMPSSTTLMEFYQNGNVKKGRLYQDTDINGIMVAGNSEVLFHENGTLERCALAQDTIINGYTIPAGITVYFYDNGTIKQFYSLSGIVVDGIAVKGVIQFHDNGSLKKGTLVNNTVINNMQFIGFIELYEDGTVKAGNLNVPTDVGEYRVGSGNVSFHADGSLASGYLLGTYTINGVNYTFGISIYSNGQVANGKLVNDTKINNIWYKRDVSIQFYSNGVVKEGIIKGYALIDGIRYKNFIAFHENGQLKYSVLVEDTVINGITYEAGSMMEYDDAGNIV
ncbi:putative Ig domain-containing protein [Candidatus Margulisiibacteriota bacterium]